MLTTKGHSEEGTRMFIFKLIVSIVKQAAILACLLFLPAGTLDWWRAWLLIGVLFVGSVASVAVLLPGRRDLLRERLKSPIQKGQPLGDKIILILFLMSFYGLIVFIPMDVFRLHLMTTPGVLVSSLGMCLFLFGWWIAVLALRENIFAVTVVKLQEERKHRVVDTGVYGVVRHPMYTGGILFVVGLPLWLESYTGALLTLVPTGILVLRIFFEERYLIRNLKGYESYMKRVRYRLIPLLW
ncbi:MAG: methyltransferase family protein [Dissulfurispiraceae bacterium]